MGGPRWALCCESCSAASFLSGVNKRLNSDKGKNFLCSSWNQAPSYFFVGQIDMSSWGVSSHLNGFVLSENRVLRSIHWWLIIIFPYFHHQHDVFYGYSFQYQTPKSVSWHDRRLSGDSFGSAWELHGGATQGTAAAMWNACAPKEIQKRNFMHFQTLVVGSYFSFSLVFPWFILILDGQEDLKTPDPSC